ncbi:MAG: ATP-binding protein [Bacteroidetes bacterium]|nr:ATP-binding protein [Bacteroidota bacterium]
MEQTTGALILLRGLPGSGKSSLAKLLSENGKYPVFSIDSYFTDPVTGAYAFDPYKNHLAYKQCEEQAEAAMKKGIQKIFVDNTFTIEWEIEPYFKMAAATNYSVFAVTVENRHGSVNTHGITNEQLEKMAAKYKVKLL